MKKQNADASAARTVNRPLFILSLVVRVIAVLAAVFCLYRVAQLVGGNNVSLSDTQITAAVRDTSGRMVHTSGDLRKNTGSGPETARAAGGLRILSCSRNEADQSWDVSAVYKKETYLGEPEQYLIKLMMETFGEIEKNI